MSAQDRVRWDTIYTTRADKPYPPPDPLLFDYTPPIGADQTRTALDLAGGLGQNGLWLAAQGYTTDIMDISRVALTRARGEMAMRNLRNVNLLQIDVDTVDLGAARYDVLCVFRYLRRDLFSKIRAAIKPGGRVIYETFNFNYLMIVPGFNVDFLLQGDELSDAFAGWQILINEQSEHVTQFAAVKPDQITVQPMMPSDATDAFTSDAKPSFDW